MTVPEAAAVRRPPGLGAWTLGRAGDALLEARSACSGRSLDLSSITECDSAAVAILVALRRERGSSLQLHSPPPRLRALAALYGVEGLLFDPAALSASSVVLDS